MSFLELDRVGKQFGPQTVVDDFTLAVGKGGRFASPVLELRTSGRGRLDAHGEVTLETTRGAVRGGPGTVRW